MTPTSFFLGLSQLALAGAVLLLSHYGLGLLAAVLVAAPLVLSWVRSQRTQRAALELSPRLIAGLSVVLLISLSREPIGQSVFPVLTQVALAIFYGLWLIVLGRQRPSSFIVAAVHQVLAISAIFLAAAFWHWPNLVVVALTWVVSFVIAAYVLEAREDRSAKLLATAWALIAGEIAWALEVWQVNYVIPPNQGYVIVPQAAIIALGTGYCLANIYLAHADKRLSRRRLLEYVAIAGVLLAIVIAGTRWSGTT